MGEQHVVVGVPTYDGRLEHGTANAINVLACRERRVLSMVGAASLLSMNCNKLYCEALNFRESHSVKWFAMLHADIVPDPYWLDMLIEEAEKHDADFMSAVVPIKSNQGLTSTAFYDPGNEWKPLTRLTMKQVNSLLWKHETFDALAAISALWSLNEHARVHVPNYSQLLANTGCMVVRIDREWSDKICFQTRDRIVKTPNGYQPQVQPEDWLFSRQIADHGGKVMVTKKVGVIHKGTADFSSRASWGLDRDE